MIGPLARLPDYRCADCGAPLDCNSWRVSGVEGLLCDRCGRDRVEIRMRLRFQEGAEREEEVLACRT